MERLTVLRAPCSVHGSRREKRASRTRLFLYLLVLSTVHGARCTIAYAESPLDLFKAGNAAYAEGKFADAAQKYQAAADEGLKHWVLEYNLGNAYYRSGQNGKAIVHYERAFRLNSGQRDVLYNLNLASTKAGDPVLPSSALPALGWRLFYILSINTLTTVVSLLFILACLGVAWKLLGGLVRLGSDPMSTRGLTPSLQAVFGVFILALAWLGVRIYCVQKPEGVVVTSVAEVRSGPNTTYPTSFTVPEGRRVLILKEQEPIQGWLEIGVPQEGLKGWVPDTAVEVI